MNPDEPTRWVDEATCHAEMRDAGDELVLERMGSELNVDDAGDELVLEGVGVAAADINWIVSGLMDPRVFSLGRRRLLFVEFRLIKIVNVFDYIASGFWQARGSYHFKQ